MNNPLIWLLLVLLAAGAAAFFVWRQRHATPQLSGDDRFTAAEAISPAHARLLEYLQAAFPGQVVLFRPSLAQLVSVRVAGNRQQMLRWLGGQAVDFVVCATDGKPEYAFDVRERSASTDAQAKQISAMKTRVLKTAGVRLLRLQRSVRDLPPADEFRPRLVESLSMGFSSTPRKSTTARAGQSAHSPQGETIPSDLGSLTDLMGLPPAADNAAAPAPAPAAPAPSMLESGWHLPQQKPARG